ncbi:MAG: hypothetical protein AAF499_14855, partial [Pseudomonadota bacterium]
MIKKFLKPALWIFLGSSLCGVVFFFFFTLKTAQALFHASIPEAGSDRFFLLDNRLSVRLAVDQKQVGLLGSRADVRISLADGADIPLRVSVSYGPLFLSGDKRFALARWRVLSRMDIVSGELNGWMNGYTGFDGSVSLRSRIIEGRTTLPFGAGRLVLRDASMAFEKSPRRGEFSLDVSAADGRVVMPNQHAYFSGAHLMATALPVSWDDLGGRRETPQTFARGEFEIASLRLRRRDSEQLLERVTGEFDSKVFADTLSLEVFGLVGSLPVFSPVETGELEYSFL